MSLQNPQKISTTGLSFTESHILLCSSMDNWTILPYLSENLIVFSRSKSETVATSESL